MSTLPLPSISPGLFGDADGIAEGEEDGDIEGESDGDIDGDGVAVVSNWTSRPLIAKPSQYHWPWAQEGRGPTVHLNVLAPTLSCEGFIGIWKVAQSPPK